PLAGLRRRPRGREPRGQLPGAVQQDHPDVVLRRPRGQAAGQEGRRAAGRHGGPEPRVQVAISAAEAAPAGVALAPLRRLLSLPYRYRFDPAAISPHERARRRAESAAWLAAPASAPASPSVARP